MLVWVSLCRNSQQVYPSVEPGLVNASDTVRLGLHCAAGSNLSEPKTRPIVRCCGRGKLNNPRLAVRDKSRLPAESRRKKGRGSWRQKAPRRGHSAATTESQPTDEVYPGKDELKDLKLKTGDQITGKGPSTKVGNKNWIRTYDAFGNVRNA
jgi:hypothetical protein